MQAEAKTEAEEVRKEADEARRDAHQARREAEQLLTEMQALRAIIRAHARSCMHEDTLHTHTGVLVGAAGDASRKEAEAFG